MLRSICISAVLAASFAATSGQAAVFAVDSTADLADLAPGNGVCDANPTAAVVCTLRAAVQEANALAGNDSISLPAGTYALTRAGLDSTADKGDLDVTSVISIAGAGPGLSVIEQTTADRVFEVWLPPSALSLFDVTVRGGDAGPTGLGGGIRNVGLLSLAGVHLTDNAAQYGGGLFNFGSVQIADSVIDANVATVRIAGIASASVSASGNESTYLEMYSSTVGPNITTGGPTEIEFGNGNSAMLFDSTIAPMDPGAVAIDVANENVVLDHVTMRGGLRTYSFDGSQTLTISNSVVEWCAFNGAQQPLIERLGSDASSDGSCGFAAAGGIEGPLGLGALADNGGLSPTYLPQPGSALIDAASTDVCRTTDQRGIDRPQGAACDIGAVEVVPESSAIGAALAAIASLAWLRRRI